MASSRIGELGRNAVVGWVGLAGRRPWLVAGLAALVTAAALFATATRLSINTSISDMLSPELPFRQNLMALDRAFPQRDNPLTIVVEAGAPEAADTAAERLVEAMRARPALFRAVFYPPGDPFFRRNGLLYLDLDELEALADRLAEMQPLLAGLRRDPSLRGLAERLAQFPDDLSPDLAAALAPALEAMAATAEAAAVGPPAPLSWRALAEDGTPSAQTTRRFISVQPVLDFGGFTPAAAALDAIESLSADLSADLGAGDGPRVRVTGEPAMRQDELLGLRDGMGLVSLVSLALVVGLLAAGLRSLRLILPTVATLLAGLAATAGFAAIAIGELNLISVAFAVLFIGLSVDFGIHFALRYREEIQAGRAHAAALEAAAAGVGGALALTALAAAIGFFSFLPTAYRGLSELGLISGVGMFIALFCNLTVLPALLSLKPLEAGVQANRGGGPRLFLVPGRWSRAVLGLSLLLALAAAAALPFARFDDDPMKLRDPDSPSVAVLMELIDDPRVEPYSARVLAADLEQGAALAEHLERLPEVAAATTLLDAMPADQDAKLAVIDDMALFLGPLLLPVERLPPPGPDDRAAAGQSLREIAEALAGPGADAPLAAAARRLSEALALIEDEPARLADLEAALFERLPALIDKLGESLLAGPVALADLPADLRARLVAADGRALVDIRPAEDLRDQAARRRFVAAVRTVAPAASGAPVVITEAGQAVVRAYRQAATLAIAAISLLLLAVLRRPGPVLLVLAPLVLAALLTVAVTAVFGPAFNFANVIVLPLLFGLGVAGSLHMVLRARQDALARLPATSTPRAVLFSALTTLGSFGALALSPHPGTASMGLLLAVAIALTLASTLLVLPALLHALDGRGGRGGRGGPGGHGGRGGHGGHGGRPGPAEPAEPAKPE